MQDKLVNAEDAATLLAVSVRRFHELRHIDGFPGAIALGPRCLRWAVAELLLWAQSQPRRTPGTEPARLVLSRDLRRQRSGQTNAPKR